jgi:hypothetical protein
MKSQYNVLSKQRLQIPDVPGVSLVAYYGNKPLKLQQLITELQQLLKDSFATNFIPYDLKQVHATIIGCEGVKTKSGIINKWFYALRNEIRYIDCAGLLNYFLTSNLFLLNICFGGYQDDVDYQFLSRDRHPAVRSFQLQIAKDNTLIPIVIGWSLQEQIITTEIDNIRRNLQQFNCLHKYHKFPHNIDNDVYLRLGTITTNFNSDLIATIQQKVNYYLQNKKPTIIPLSKENLAIAKYQSLSLPISTTEIYSLAKLYNNPKLIQQLYS